MEDSSRTIKLWVQYLKLPTEYADTFINEGFDDYDFLAELTETDMSEIGIRKRGHVKRILKFVANFSEESPRFFKKYQIKQEIRVKTPSASSVNTDAQFSASTRRRRIKRMRNTRTQTTESDVIVTTTKIPPEIVENEICKELFYFVKKSIVLLESGYTEKFLTSSFHPVDQFSLKTLNYSIPELLKMFEDGETNISKASMLELLKRFLEEAKDWIVNEYVVECASDLQKSQTPDCCFNDRYGGRYAATYKEKKEAVIEEVNLGDEDDHQKDIPRKIHFRHFRDKWYLTNFS